MRDPVPPASRPRGVLGRILSRLAGIGVVLATAPSFAADSINFNRDIRPILAEHCFACHGPDRKQRKADLRLDIREAVLESDAIVPGKPDDSSLVERIESTDPTLIMPPLSARKPLSERQREPLRHRSRPAPPTWSTGRTHRSSDWLYPR
jgi:hypothetical protein